MVVVVVVVVVVAVLLLLLLLLLVDGAGSGAGGAVVGVAWGSWLVVAGRWCCLGLVLVLVLAV